jgi:hypothetical protein
MKTLELRNGDLVIRPGGFGMVRGTKKVQQDLGTIVREALGTDRFHPRFGTVLHDYLGGYQDATAYALIRGELHRLINNYIMVQTGAIQADMARGRRPRYGPEEIITSVQAIQIQQRLDRFNVKVVVRTASGEDVTLLRSVGV